MPATTRAQQLLAEHLNGRSLPVRLETRGRPSGPPPPPEPQMAPLPPMPAPLPDDGEPAGPWALAFGRPYTRGELRAQAWLAETRVLYVAHANRHWEWKKSLTVSNRK